MPPVDVRWQWTQSNPLGGVIQLFVAEMKEEKDEDEEGEEREDEKEGEACDGCVFGLCERFSAKERVAWGLRVIVGIEEVWVAG